MSTIWNRIKDQPGIENDPYMKDNALAYDELLIIKKFTQSEGGKKFRKKLLHNTVTSVYNVMSADVSDTNNLIKKIALLNADVKLLQEFDGIDETIESLYETLKEVLEK